MVVHLIVNFSGYDPYIIKFKFKYFKMVIYLIVNFNGYDPYIIKFKFKFLNLDF